MYLERKNNLISHIFSYLSGKKKLLAVFAVVILVVFGLHFLGAKTTYAESLGLEDYDSYLDSGNQSSEEGPSDDYWGAGLVKGILKLLLSFAGILLSAATSLFQAIITPGILDLIMNNGAIYSAWQMVRDFLNIIFIFVLLYSAFCTVFQVDKYHWSKVVPNLILMALLVNFSYPITRFIIDVSNVIMYFFINSFSSTSTILDITKHTEMEAILAPGSASTLLLLSAVIFTFIFALTMLSLALLLVARAIVLAILIIFSPIAFVGPILPGSELASQASSWWKKLMENAFFGPNMLFMVGVAVSLMNAMTKAGLQQQFSSIASKQSGIPFISNLIGQIAFFSIPIILIWMGMLSAKKGSIAGGNMIIGRAEKFAKSAGRNIGGIRPLASWGFKKTGIPGGVKKRWNKSWFSKDAIQKRQEKADDRIYRKIGGKTDEEQEMRKKAEEHKKDGKSKSALIKDAQNGSSSDAYRMASDGDMDSTTYAAAMEKIKDSKVRDAITSKTKEKNIKAIIDHEITQEENRLGIPLGTLSNSQKKTLYAKHLDELDVDGLKKQQGLHENITTDPVFEEYIRDMKSDPYQAEFHKELFKKMKKSQRTAYASKGLHA